VRDYQTGCGLVIGFIALIHSTRNYKSYSAIAVLHTLQFTVTHALLFSVFTSRNLATDFNTVIIPVCHCSTHKVFFAQPNSFLAISSQSFNCHLNRLSQFLFQLAWNPRYIASGRIQQKTPFPSLQLNNTSTVVCLFVAEGTCLPSRCLQ
jgi:hypothetical protein